MPVTLEDFPGGAKNRKEKFIRAVQSVIDQTYKKWELIIIADGCNETINVYQQNYSIFDNIRCFYISKQQMFAGVLRNIGIQKAVNQYIIYLDSDDYFGAEHLENISTQLETDWVYFDNIYKRPDGDWISETKLITGSATTSTICHKRGLKAKWTNGYRHDIDFIEQLKKYSYKKINNNQYYVCHVRLDYDN